MSLKSVSRSATCMSLSYISMQFLERRSMHLQAKEAASGSKLKRVQSDNSLQPRQPSGASDDWEAVSSGQASKPSTPRRASQSGAPSGSARQDVTNAGRQAQTGAAAIAQRGAAQRYTGPESTSGRDSAGGPSQPPFDAGNVMGMSANTAQWRSKGGFIGRPRARVKPLSTKPVTWLGIGSLLVAPPNTSCN